MKSESPLRFKIATEDWEFEAIHRLNYKTFVEEIPQHERNPEQRLVDKFHAENTYAICLAGNEVVGMVCGRFNRPFSLDKKVPNLDDYVPKGYKVLEVRLLSVEKQYRNGYVFSKVVGLISQHFKDLGQVGIGRIEDPRRIALAVQGGDIVAADRAPVDLAGGAMGPPFDACEQSFDSRTVPVNRIAREGGVVGESPSVGQQDRHEVFGP